MNHPITNNSLKNATNSIEKQRQNEAPKDTGCRLSPEALEALAGFQAGDEIMDFLDGVTW